MNNKARPKSKQRRREDGDDPEDPGVDDGQDEEEYQVEKVMKKRIRNGVTEYLLKWRNFDESENSWEPEANLDCPDLIADFESHQKPVEKEKESSGTPKDEPPAKKRAKGDEKPKGFDRGLDHEKIIGATDASGELTFLIKWKGTEEADLVPARIANVKCPQVVIKFYEERLTWQTHPSNQTVEEIS